MGQLMRASGTFEVTMAAANGNDGAKGAKPIMLYWDECASTFQFKAGVGGEDVYHIVWETRRATPGTSTAYLCIATHTKSNTKPSADSSHWQRLSNLAMIATDLMLTRQILASEIDVDNLTVKNVNAVSSDGKTTAKIDGETGKLTAKNAEFQDANVSGSLTVTRMSFMNRNTYYLKQMSYMLGASGYYFAEQLTEGELQKIDVFAVPSTKTITSLDIQSDGKCHVTMYVDGEFIGEMKTGESSVNFSSGFNYSGYIIGLGYDTYTKWDIILHK